MLTSRFIVMVFSVASLILSAGAAYGQNYPTKPIRIVASEPGGGSNLIARLIAQAISGPVGQPVIVDNRGSGVIPAETVAKAPADGYTLLHLNSVLWLGPLIQNMPYDPVRDFAPITSSAGAPNILVVHPSLPVKSVKELIVLAKARPGELNYGSGPTGSSNHLAAELFKAIAGVTMVRIPYNGAGPALNALIGGEVHLMFATASAGITHVKSGRLRALAVTSSQPSVLVPDLPTVAAAGLRGYESQTIYGVFAPAKTPAAIVARLNQEIVRFLNTGEAKEQLLKTGTEAVPSSPEQYATTIKSEMLRMGKVIKDAGIRAD